MTPTTFPCPFCGRKMGVGPDLLGRKVRCPHCKQVIVAPAAGGAAPTPPAPAPAADLPVFNLPSPEQRESIFGEHADETDDVFGSDPGTLPVPELPPPVTPPPVAVPPPPPVVVFAPPPVAVPAPTGDPFAGFTAAAAPTPAVAVYPVPLPAPANPWAGFDQPATPPQATTAAPPTAHYAAPAEPPVAIPAPPPEPRRTPRDRRPDRGRPAATPAGGTNKLLLIGCIVLAPYALLMTVLAVYGLFIRDGGKVPDGHPLSLIPDARGEFPPADRRKTGKLGVPVDGPLPPELRAGLGQSVAVGAVDVRPEKVEVRKLNLVRVQESGMITESTTAKAAVVLSLRVRNTSADLSFHPLDPAFNRLASAADAPPTVLVAGKGTFPGGAVKWPFERVRRAYEKEQAEDDKPLEPGESRRYVVTTEARTDVVKAVQTAKEPLLWRVQVRRGLVEYRGREVPVTALIGVEFRAADVATPPEE